MTVLGRQSQLVLRLDRVQKLKLAIFVALLHWILFILALIWLFIQLHVAQIGALLRQVAYLFQFPACDQRYLPHAIVARLLLAIEHKLPLTLQFLKIHAAGLLERLIIAIRVLALLLCFAVQASQRCSAGVVLLRLLSYPQVMGPDFVVVFVAQLPVYLILAYLAIKDSRKWREVLRPLLARWRYGVGLWELWFRQLLRYQRTLAVQTRMILQ